MKRVVLIAIASIALTAAAVLMPAGARAQGPQARDITPLRLALEEAVRRGLETSHRIA